MCDHITKHFKVCQKYFATRRIQFQLSSKVWKCGKERSLMSDVIYRTRETVFQRDIQTPRRELKIRR